jgi:putative SOS response-associated peptidase YedK
MCSRYSASADPAALARRFGVAAAPGLKARRNIASGETAPVVLAAPAPRMSLMRFGLKPGWARENAALQLNARAETAAEKPFFREAFRARRLLVVADGWFEFPRRGADRAPRYFRRADGEPFAFAGLWEPGGFAILTVPANPLVARVHDRMPAVLAPDDEAAWLDAAADPAALCALLRPFSSGILEIRRVSERVREGADDAAALAEALPPQGDLFGSRGETTESSPAAK